MVEVYSVESVLTLQDRQMLAGLREVSKALKTIQSQLDKMKLTMKSPEIGAGTALAQMKAMRTEMKGLATDAVALRTTLGAMEISPEAVKGVSTMSRSLGNAEKRADRLKATLAGMTVPPVLPPGRRPGGGGGGRRTPKEEEDDIKLRGRYHAGPVGAHFGIGPVEIGAMVAGGLAYVGVKEAAHVQQSVNSAILAMGVNPQTAQGKAMYEELTGTVAQVSQGSIFSPSAVAEPLPALGMTLTEYEKTKDLIRPGLRYAEASAMMGKAQGQSIDATDSFKSLITTSHVLGTLDPQQMEKVANMALVAQMSTGQTPRQLEKVIKYFGGTGRLLGMTPEQTVEFGAISGLGLAGSTGGTALNQLLLGMLPGSGKKSSMKAAELKKMGLTDAKGEPLTDPMKIIEGLANYRATHKASEVTSKFKDIFNVRGMREADWISFGGVLDRFKELKKRMGDAPTAQQMQQIMIDSNVISQQEAAWANLKGILNDLTAGTLPAFSGMWKGILDAEWWIQNQLTDKKGHWNALAQGLGYGLEGVTAGLAAWLGGRLIGQIGRRMFGFGRGAAGAAAGAAEGAGVAAAEGGVAAAITAGGLSITAAFASAAAVIAVEAAGYFSYRWLQQHTEEEAAKGHGVTFTDPMSGAPMAWGLPAQPGDNWGDHEHGPGRPPWKHPASRYGSFGDREHDEHDEAGSVIPMAARPGGGGPVSLTGTANLTGTTQLTANLHLDMGQLGSMVAKLIAEGIHHAAGIINSGARPDPSGGLPHVSSAY